MAKILYNDGKWDGIWDLPKYQEMRDKITEAFKDLTFVEEGHKYFLHGKEITCVSNVTHMFKEPFHAHEKAIETSERNYNNPDSKYYRMTPEEIEEAWKLNSQQACEHGTERHLFAENLYYYWTKQYDKICSELQNRLTEDGGFTALYPKEEAAGMFYKNMPKCLVPIMPETKVYSEKYGFSGTFDLLCYYDAKLEGKDEKNNGLFVLDWKTNKDLYKNFNEQKLLNPFEGLLDMPISLYKLQLSCYSLCLEDIGMKVIARRLMWLKPDGSYDKIPLESYVAPLRKALSDINLSKAEHS